MTRTFPPAVAIEKRATNPRAFLRPMLPYANARSAFKAFMQGIEVTPTDVVLLPAFVGWSAREGSGVFDPVQELGCRFDFYRMTDRLEIDTEDLQNKVQRLHPRLVVLIHYFGFPDPAYPEAVDLVRRQGAMILEDEAHAMYSDLVGGRCGRLGDAAIFSLHKMLPVGQGGALVLNDSALVDTFSGKGSAGVPPERSLMDYDLYQIAECRKRNAEQLLELVAPLEQQVEPLHKTLEAGIVPQTLPVLIHSRSRDEIYFEMNARGFGVVTLYHTLIKPISIEKYPDSHHLARRILNLPVHQDISPDGLEAMIDALAALV